MTEKTMTETVNLTENGKLQLGGLRNNFLVVEHALNDLGPGREKSLALTKLEECLMWATRAHCLDDIKNLKD